MTRSPGSMNSGTWIDEARLEGGGLARARHPVALDARLGLGDRELDRRGEVDADDLVAEHQQHRGRLLDEVVGGVAERRGRDRRAGRRCCCP